MKKVLMLLTTVSALSMAMPANADLSRLYFGVDYAEFQWDNKGVTGTYPDKSGYTMRLGYDFNNILSVEGHLLKPGEFAHQTTSSLNQKFDYGASAYVRANLRFERTTVYVLGGATYLKDASGDDTDIGYGAGIDFYGTKNAALTLSYVSNYNASINGVDKQLNMLSLGFTIYLDPPKFSRRY